MIARNLIADVPATVPAEGPANIRSRNSAPLSEPLISQMMDSIGPASVAFLTRFPDGSPDLRLPPVQAALAESIVDALPEPCDVAAIVCDASTMALVVTPKSQRPLDPLQIHTVSELLRHTLARDSNSPDPSAAQPVLLPLTPLTSVSAMQENIAELNELLETILNKQMGVQFQPIVHFASGAIFGYESLIRMPQTGSMKRAGMYFNAADHARLVSWLDIACQERCFESAVKAGVRDHLFINMDAEGLAHLHLAEQSLAVRAAEYNIPPSRVVLEITERQAVEDYPRLNQYIEQLREEGFKIAIDDAGAGYSSLHTIAELRPDFVKIDRSLVRTIENSATRRALLSTLTHYAQQIGAQVIAEGIETRDELATVVEMGVPLGQGYLLGKPNDGFKGLREEMRTFLREHLDRRRNRVGGRDYPIEKMARYGVILPSSAPIPEAARKFSKMPDMESIVLADEGRIEGLLMRDRFDEARRQQGEQLDTLTAAAIMDRQPLIVEVGTKLEDVAQRATYRRTMRFHDDIVVGRAGEYVGVVPVRALMEALSTRHVNRLKYAHPLTGLPGSPIIEETCDTRLKQSVPTSVVLASILHFRPFNEHFGMSLGDEALLAAARIIEQNILKHGKPDDFVGHLGGNDFVILVDPSRAEPLCAACVVDFRSLSPHLYTPEHNRRGRLDSVDRAGKPVSAPLMEMSISIASTRSRALLDFRQALALARETNSRVSGQSTVRT